MEHNNEKYAVDSAIVSRKIDFTDYGLQKDHPPASELKHDFCRVRAFDLF